MSSDTPPEGLTLLNRAPSLDAEALLRSCCGSHRWARRIAAHRPYPTLAALLAAADEAAYDLTSGDLAEALAGEHAVPPPAHGNPAVHTALRAAYAAYEAKFGHVFVLAPDGDDEPTAVLDRTMAALRERLGHDEERESAVTAEQLRQLAGVRLAGLAGSPDRAGSITPDPPHGAEPTSRRYDGRGRWTVPGRA